MWNIFFIIYNSSSFRVILNKNVHGPKELQAGPAHLWKVNQLAKSVDWRWEDLCWASKWVHNKRKYSYLQEIHVFHTPSLLPFLSVSFPQFLLQTVVTSLLCPVPRRYLVHLPAYVHRRKEAVCDQAPGIYSFSHKTYKYTRTHVVHINLVWTHLFVFKPLFPAASALNLDERLRNKFTKLIIAIFYHHWVAIKVYFW